MHKEYATQQGYTKQIPRWSLVRTSYPTTDCSFRQLLHVLVPLDGQVINVRNEHNSNASRKELVFFTSVLFDLPSKPVTPTQPQGTGGDVDCFAGDAILIVYETEKIWERTGEEVRARIEGPNGGPVSKLTLATMVASQCGGRLLNKLSPYYFSDGATDAALTLHGSIGAGSVRTVNIGGSMAHVSTLPTPGLCWQL